MMLDIIFWMLVVLTAVAVIFDLIRRDFLNALLTAVLFFPAWFAYSVTYKFIEGVAKSSSLLGIILYLSVLFIWFSMGNIYSAFTMPKELRPIYLLFSWIMLLLLGFAI